jgi:hypothetical protein
MNASQAASHLRLVNRTPESMDLDLSEAQLTTLLDYIVHTRLRTRRTEWTKARHANLTSAQNRVFTALKAIRLTK